MGRTYKRKVGGRRYKDYKEETLEEALEKVVNEGWSLNRSSKEFGVPFGTLYNKYKGMHGKVVRSGKKYPENIINHSKSAISVMFCGSASGVLLPPYIIYKSEHMWDRWTENGPKGIPCCAERCCSSGSRYNRTKNRWIEASCFTDWFKRSFLPHAIRLPGKKVLIGDNLTSHFTDEVLQLCQENNIAFICLPPNSTHLTQPLDIAFFRPLKSAWRSVLLKWKMENPKLSSLKKEEFPMLLKNTLDKMNESGNHAGDAIGHNLRSGFEATGVHPWNPEKVLNKIPNENKENEPFSADYENNLLAFLKEKRYNNNPVRGPSKKKKRLNIVAGRSVSCPESESENDDELTNHREDTSVEILVNSAHDEEVEYISVEPNNIEEGTFLLVRVLSGKRNATYIRYIAIVEKKLEYDEYEVVGLKSTDTEKSIFKEVENDKFTIAVTDIIAVLSEPKIENSGTRLKRYIFTKPVDVFER